MTVSEIRELLSSAGIRPTQQRIAVYKALCENRIHPSVSTVYSLIRKDNPSLSLATVYNAMEAFCRAGIVKRLAIDGDEARYDVIVRDHGHFLCKQCGQIYDIALSGIGPQLPGGFEITKREVYCEGICSKCREQ